MQTLHPLLFLHDPQGDARKSKACLDSVELCERTASTLFAYNLSKLLKKNKVGVERIIGQQPAKDTYMTMLGIEKGSLDWNDTSIHQALLTWCELGDRTKKRKIEGACGPEIHGACAAAVGPDDDQPAAKRKVLPKAKPPGKKKKS